MEEAVGDQLKEAKVKYKYESLTIDFIQPEKERKYTPDFVLANGIIIETKGRMVTADRQKILMVMEQYPDLDIRIAFSRPNGRIAKKSKTTYARWASDNGIRWCGPQIPDRWLEAPANRKSLKAIKKIMEGK